MSDYTYYGVLGVSETATQAEIKAAYRDLLKKIHPDTVSTLSPSLRREAELVTTEIIAAYTVLSDATKRREYDWKLWEQRGKQDFPFTSPQEVPPATWSSVSTRTQQTQHYAGSRQKEPVPPSPTSPHRTRTQHLQREQKLDTSNPNADQSRTSYSGSNGEHPELKDLSHDLKVLLVTGIVAFVLIALLMPYLDVDSQDYKVAMISTFLAILVITSVILLIPGD